jgi:hypothetical protein
VTAAALEFNRVRCSYAVNVLPPPLVLKTARRCLLRRIGVVNKGWTFDTRRDPRILGFAQRCKRRQSIINIRLGVRS